MSVLFQIHIWIKGYYFIIIDTWIRNSLNGNYLTIEHCESLTSASVIDSQVYRISAKSHSALDSYRPCPGKGIQSDYGVLETNI